MSFSNPLHPKQPESGYADKLAHYTLLLLAFLLPFCMGLGSVAPLLYTKVLVAGILLLVAAIAFSVARLQTQTISLPRVWLLGAAWLLPAAYLVSSMFQANMSLSLLGERLQVDSFLFVLLLTLALTLVTLVLTTKERVLSLYMAMLGGGAVLTVLQLGIFFARDTLGALGLTFTTASLLGSLNDLAVFFGLLSILALATLTLLPLTNLVRYLLWATLAIAAFFLVIVDLNVLWWIVGLFALAFLVYSVTVARTQSRNGLGISFPALAIVVLAAVFLLGSDTFTGALARKANVGELDVRPSWKTTISIGKSAYAENALFGTGPGTFTYLWSKYRPIEVDQTPFWGTDFAFGIGFIPTSFVTTGLVGAFAWLVFLLLFLWSGIRAFILTRGEDHDPISAYLRISAFVGALFLWIILFIQVPSPALIVYAFLLTGLFIASLRFGHGPVLDMVLSFKNNPRLGFVATLVLTLGILGSVTGLYTIGMRYAAEAQFQRALVVANTTTDVDLAEQLTTRAITLHPTDLYYRLSANITQVRIQQLLAQNKPPEEIREQFQNLLSRAIADAMEATTLDQNDYQNWLTLGTIYQGIAPLGIEGAAASAQAALDRALALRPDAPAILLAQASIARQEGDSATARRLVERAISVRNQYTDAIFLLAQIQIENNEIENAVRSVEAATLFDPSNAVAFFQLGLLQYSATNYAEAARALEQAVRINDQYANARYFLGLTYAQQGRSQEALIQFREVQRTNPDNQEVAQIISNLEAGRSPFQNLENEPVIEELDAPPVNEPAQTGAGRGAAGAELSE